MNSITEEEKACLQEIGKKIAFYRKKTKMTQKDFAEKAGIDRSAFARLEAGGVNSTVLKLREIALVLDVPLKKLFG